MTFVRGNNSKKKWLIIHRIERIAGKDIFSPDVESSAPSSVDPQNMSQGVKQTSRTSSFEIENLLKTAEQVIAWNQ